MKKKMVSYTMETLPPPTDEDRIRLAEVFSRPDSEVDTSDLPELTDEQRKNTPAVRGLFYRAAPNAETLAAMKAGDECKVSKAANVAEMMAQLHTND